MSSPPAGHQVELTGRLGSVVFPNRCANCGAATTERLRFRKVFGRGAGYRRRASLSAGDGYRIDAAEVPYCAACVAQDARERPSLARRWRERLPSLVLASVPALPCLGFAGYLMTTIAPAAVENGADGFERGLVLLFGGWGAALLGRAWWTTRNYMVPRQTSVTLAFDFGPDISDALDPAERRIYTMRDAVFAEAFVQLNRDRVWAPDPAAERAEARVWTGALVLLALGGLLALLLNR